jgi:hypothetical protein
MIRLYKKTRTFGKQISPLAPVSVFTCTRVTAGASDRRHGGSGRNDNIVAEFMKCRTMSAVCGRIIGVSPPRRFCYAVRFSGGRIDESLSVPTRRDERRISAHRCKEVLNNDGSVPVRRTWCVLVAPPGPWDCHGGHSVFSSTGR